MADEANTQVSENAAEHDEPLGSQVLRRIHEDAGILLAEYDEMTGVLEQEDVRKHLEEVLAQLEEIMTKSEELHSSTYPDLEQLEGAEEVGEEAGEEEAEEEAQEAAEGEAGEKAVEGAETEATEADSREEEAPTPEEAYEASQTKKSLARKKIKALKVQKKKDFEEAEKQDEEVNVTEGGEKSLDFYPHKKHLGEGHAYLKELAEKEHFSDEDKMKSYHFHKGFGDVVAHVTGMGGEKSQIPGDHEFWQEEAREAEHKGGLGIEDGHEPGDEAEKKDFPAAEHADEMVDLTERENEHPHVKAIREASGHFADLAKLAPGAMPDEHRQKSMMHYKALEPVISGIGEPQPNDQPVPTPGETDTKALAERFKKQYEDARQVNDQVVQLHRRLTGKV